MVSLGGEYLGFGLDLNEFHLVIYIFIRDLSIEGPISDGPISFQ